MPRKGSKVKGDDSARDDVVRAVRREGKKIYKRMIGYSDRHVVWSSFVSFKGMFGESLMSRKRESARLEVFLKAWAHNRLSVMNTSGEKFREAQNTLGKSSSVGQFL